MQYDDRPLPPVSMRTQGEHIMPCTQAQMDDLSCPGFFLNHELSWLEFNRRVLHEAFEPHAPLLEQLKFLSIFYRNLDEFFMVRVAAVLHRYLSHTPSSAPDGMAPARQLAEIRRRTLPMLSEAQEHWRKKLFHDLWERGVRITRYADLTPRQQHFLDKYFIDEIYPILTPQAIDPRHPMPVISNLTLNFIIELTDKNGIVRHARLKNPKNVPRCIFTPRTRDAKTYAALGFCSNTRDNDIVLLEDLIRQHLHTLFPGYTIQAAELFRITRNTDLGLEKEDTNDVREAVRELVDQRRFGTVVRLELAHAMPCSLRRFLSDSLLVKPFQMYRVKGPLAFADMGILYDLDRPGLKEAPLQPFVPPAFRKESDVSIFTHIAAKDTLLFHPYDSFVPVQDWIRQASNDPGVIAIKQTLYRPGKQSPIVDALIEARRHGKQVTAVLELRARFDEESNIVWAEEMERAGVHVVYGMAGMKIHTKLGLVVRREAEGVRRYVHICSGNYNAGTARFYTDMGLFTAHPGICSDVSELFNVMTGYAEKSDYRHLLISPVGLRQGILRCIEEETARHRTHGDGDICIKCTQLGDRECIQALYRASQAGVRVRLQVRGVCCLRPGVPGISDNIEVTSLVGRFLEHVRIYYFHNGGEARILMGSADPMPRNLDRRLDLLVPVLDPDLRTHLYEDILLAYCADMAKTHILQEDGTYTRRQPAQGEAAYNAQQVMIDLREALAAKRS